MTKRDTEQAIKRAVERQTPDVWDAVMAECRQPTNGKVMIMEHTTKKQTMRAWVACAAAVILLVGGVFAYNHFTDKETIPETAVFSTVTLDVNPSLEITLNAAERVLAVTPLNDDAKTVIGTMDFSGAAWDVTINALIGSMLRNGYISEKANSILISVDSQNTDGGSALQKKLSDEVNSLLKTDTFSGAVLSQTVKEETALHDKAKAHGITAGKAQLIERIVAADNRYTFEQLVGLTVNELNLIASGKDINASVGSVGTASESKYIGRDKAKAAALQHAGVSETDMREYTCEMDFENGVMVYEIEFAVGNMEYEYDINATDGTVIKTEKERDDEDNRPSTQTTVVIDTAYIGEEAAKAAAFKRAGIQASAAQHITVELDEDDGVWEYNVEFVSGGFEYECDIDAKTGTVRDFEKEPQNN